MSWSKAITRHLHTFNISKVIESEIDEEFSFHLKMRIADNINRGMSPEEARADARRRFGDYEGIKSTSRKIKSAEVNDPKMRILKLCIWLMLSFGIVMRITSTAKEVQQIGSITCWIALLWFLLLHGRAMRRVAKPRR